MKSPVFAFLWQELRLSWIAIVSICAASVSFSLLAYQVGAEGVMPSMVSGLLLIILACVSTLLRSGGRESQTMPRYFLTLPVRSGFWASIHFAYGVCTLMLVGAGLFQLHAYLFEPKLEFLPIPHASVWNVVLFAGALGGLIEGVFLLVGSIGSPVLTGASLITAMTVFAVGSATFADWDSAHERNRSASSWTITRQPQPPAQSRPQFKGGPGAPVGVPQAWSPISGNHPETQANTGTIAASTATGNPKNWDLKKVEAVRAAMQEAHDAEMRAKGRYVLRKEAAPPRALSDPPLLISFWAVSLILGYLCSCAGVMSFRHGPAALLRTDIPFTAFAFLRRRQGFVSPQAAAIWFEWKRFGRYLPFLTCIPVAALLWLRDPSMSRSDLLGLGMISGAAAMPLGIYMTLRRHWDHTSGTDTFLFTLPITTRALAAARLGMAIRSVAISSVVFLLFLLVLLHSGVKPYPEATWILMSYLMFLIAVWCDLWLALPLFYFGILFSVSIQIASSVFRIRAREDFAPFMLLLAAAVAIAALTALWKAHRTRVLLGTGMALVLAASLASAYLLAVCAPEPEGLTGSVLVIVISVALVSAVPFATVPLSIRWYRHR